MLLAILAAACSSDHYSADDEPQPEPAQSEAILSLRVAIADAYSRAPQASSIEDMRELRIVITRPNGEVEVNYQTDFGGVPAVDYFGLFRLTPGEDKIIYAIANSSSTKFPFDTYPVGSNGIVEALEDYHYDFDSSLPIAMTDSRQIPASKLKVGEYTDVSLNVVRIATKFSIEVANYRYEDVELRSFAVSALGSNQYLMPHFIGNNDKYVVNNTGATGFDFDGNYDMHWSDWLRLAVNESRSDPSNELLADSRGWIMKYLVPESSNHKRSEFDFAPIQIAHGTSAEIPAHYFAESRSGLLSNSTFGNGAATGYEQSYTYDITFYSDDGGLKSFTNLQIPNLRALFRNTHVKMLVSIYQYRVVSEIRVLPYLSIELKPNFGWDALPDPEAPGSPDRDPSIDSDRNPNKNPGQPGG